MVISYNFWNFHRIETDFKHFKPSLLWQIGNAGSQFRNSCWYPFQPCPAISADFRGFSGLIQVETEPVDRDRV